MSSPEQQQAFDPASIGLAKLRMLVYDRSRHPNVRRTKICLFLGAGADISSGGLSFSELKRQCVTEFLRGRLFSVTTAEDVDTQFQRLFTSTDTEERTLFIEHICHRVENLSPSDSYKLLVLVVEEGGIDAIVTTNFDTMLEVAQHQLRRDVFQIYAAGLARPYRLTQGSDSSIHPYIKLHGDVGSRSFIWLTQADLDHPVYDAAMLDLLTELLSSHHVIFAGYSGYDSGLAEIVAAGILAARNKLFWCTPQPPNEESPLYSRLKDRCEYVPVDFDRLIRDIARPILEHPSLAATEPTYIPCLFDWRIDYCNREFLREYGERSGAPILDLLVRRQKLESKIGSFLQSDRTLAAVAGPSGFGKTILGVRLYKTWKDDKAKKLLLMKAKSYTSPDIELYLSQQLSGLGPPAPFSLSFLERWLRIQGTRLVLFIDGINEYGSEVSECVRLFRSIMRLSYFLPEGESAIRIIATIRQETWNAILPQLDLVQLRHSLWSDNSIDQSLNAIAIGPFTDTELEDALARLRERGLVQVSYNDLSSSALDRMRDPFILGIMAQTAQKPGLQGPTLTVYRTAIDRKLRSQASDLNATLVQDRLASLALNCFSLGQDTFRAADLQLAITGNLLALLRGLKDLNIIVEADSGFLRFSHDRIQEYFLALGLGLPEAPSLETLAQWRDFLLATTGNGKARAAARMYFGLHLETHFALIEAAFALISAPRENFDASDVELLFGFAREVLVELIEDSPSFVQGYLEAAITAAASRRMDDRHLRTLVQAAAYLPVKDSIAILSRIEDSGDNLAATEANIYAVDKLVRLFLVTGRFEEHLLEEAPYNLYFSAPSLQPWQRLGRLLCFLQQVGPDNCHTSEYTNLTGAATIVLEKLLLTSPWSKVALDALLTHLIANCDRLMFNATIEGIRSFFSNAQRAEFLRILARLEHGGILESSDLTALSPYFQSLRFDIEYHLTHMLFVLSAANDLNATLALWELEFSKFDDATPPEAIDFFQAVLVYLHIVFDLKYDERLAAFEERVLRDWRNVLLYRPGLARGFRRGFRDEFDMIFEDGFAVVYPYGILRPSLRRRSTGYKEYKRYLEEEMEVPLPLYAKYLAMFLETKRIDEALQILQALNSVIVAWPEVGLASLHGVLGHSDERVHRAVLRILAESYNRHPTETASFLRTGRTSLSDDDLQDIKVRQDARIGRRQVEEQQWGRVLHFLLQRPNALAVLTACLRKLLTAGDLTEALRECCSVMGLYKSDAE